MRRLSVAIDRGPITADLPLREVAPEDWHLLMLARRSHLKVRIKHDCRSLVEWVQDCERMHSTLGYGKAEEMVAQGLELDAEDVRIARAWLAKRDPEEVAAPDCNARLPVTGDELERVAAACWGDLARFAYAGFRWANAELFGGELPVPLIAWSITPHGGCLGYTDASGDGPPRITLHPSIYYGGAERERPWGIDPALLGPRYALDVLIHELMHVAVAKLRGGTKGPTSHDCPAWLAECARIAPLLGLEDAGRPERSRARRVRLEDGTSKVRRVCDGKLPFAAWARFPHDVRKALGRSDYYRGSSLPWEGCNV